MISDILPAAVVWAALGVALACVVFRLKDPEGGPESPPAESPAAEASSTGDLV